MDKQYKKQDPFFFAAMGPVCLTGALTALLFHLSAFVWPFVLLACVGLLSTWYWGKNGLFGALTGLTALVLSQYSFIHEHLWCSLFLASIALSWVMVQLGRNEVHAFDRKVQEKMGILQEEAEVTTAEMKDLSASLQNALHELSSIQETVQASKKETQVWICRCEELTREIAQFQEREKLLESTQVTNPQVPLESEEDLKSLAKLELLHRQLQRQFDEKTEILSETRKQLFRVEGELLSLQKQREEELFSLDAADAAFHRHLQDLSLQCDDLECETAHLEEVVTSLLAPKKAPRARTSKKKLSAVLDSAMKKKQSPELDLIHFCAPPPGEGNL